MAKQHDARRGSQGRKQEDNDDSPEIAEDMPISDESRQAEDLERDMDGEDEERERRMRKREIEQ